MKSTRSYESYFSIKKTFSYWDEATERLCFMEQLNWNILVNCENKSREIPQVVVSENGEILNF